METNQLTSRNIAVLKIIVEEYLKTWKVLWSKLLLEKYDLQVSSATIRNDMVKLEKLELIFQPYNSAWRLPSTKGLRAFVDYLMQQKPDFFITNSDDSIKNTSTNLKDFADSIHKITYELSNITKEISFIIIPENSIMQYNWVSNFLEKNDKILWKNSLNIVKILEEKFNFIHFISSLKIKNSVNVFIWEENISSFFKDYTIILKPIVIEWKSWYIGIIGSLKMDYSFNISAIRWII